MPFGADHTTRFSRRAARALLVAAAGAASFAVAAPGVGARPAPLEHAATNASAVTIATRLDAKGHGRFTLAGAGADSGSAAARMTKTGTKLHAQLQLTSAKGSLTLAVDRVCGRAGSTWKLVAGTD